MHHRALVSNVTSMVSSMDPYQQPIVLISWSILAAYGLITNLVVQVAIITSRRMRNAASYWLIYSLGLCDICMLLLSFVVLFPSVAYKQAYFQFDGFASAFTLTVYNTFWYAGVLHLQLMAINRHVNICHSRAYLKWFSKPRTMVLIIIVYSAGALISLPGLFKCCYVIWDYNIYAARYLHPDSFYTYIDIMVNLLSLLVMCVCYVFILIKVRQSRIMMQKLTIRQLRRTLMRSERGRKGMPFVARRELRLFVQFATVSCVFLVSTCTWQWLARTTYYRDKWSGFAVTSLFLINNSINPTVYLLFNSTLRAQLRQLLCPTRSHNELKQDSLMGMNYLGSSGPYARSKYGTTVRQRHRNRPALQHTMSVDPNLVAINGEFSNMESTAQKSTKMSLNSIKSNGHFSLSQSGSRTSRDICDVVLQDTAWVMMVQYDTPSVHV